MKKTFTILFFLLCALIVAVVGFMSPRNIISDSKQVNESGGTGATSTLIRFSNGTKIDAEVVSTPEERTRGLSGRKSLAPNAGLLFVFDQPDRYNFWMKEMNFPIDIIWIGEDFSVVDITENALPESFPELFSPKDKALYVLEVNAYFARTHAISVGDRVSFK